MSFEDDIDRILEKGTEQTAEDMLVSIEKTYGEVPYIFRFMKDNPELLITKILHNNAIIRSSQELDLETQELISIAVAAAIRCTHCLKLHLRVAKRMGISDDEIGAALLIAGNIANATVLAMATRELNEEKEACPVCQVSGGNGDPLDI
ncbi:MAG TPA: carboxymuconolactone decarboxylase family protein [Methanotrichaceae archaeon]|nr:carboxymuconolactone decarboxylase family protein [Methanotrichaceae archaeon]